jgi:hypothetical protein
VLIAVQKNPSGQYPLIFPVDARQVLPLDAEKPVLGIVHKLVLIFPLA